MGILSVAELMPDMVLAEDVKNPQGRFILAKGKILASNDIRILKMWGIVEAHVEGVSREDVDEKGNVSLDPEIIKVAENIIIPRFRHADLKNPVIKELLRLSSLVKAEEMSSPEYREGKGSHGGEKQGIEPDQEKIPATTHLDPNELIHDEINLPTLPAIYEELTEHINNPRSSAKDIGNVICKDVSFSARLLKLVNSVFYGFPSKIDSLSRAVTIVGFKQLSNLVMGISVINAFKGIPSDIIDMKSFWEHSLACGIIARILAGYVKIQNTERLFVGGLLHDVGRLLLCSVKPLHVKEIILKARLSEKLLYRVEPQMIGFDHATLGGILLKKWRLPVSVESIVKNHHTPMEAKDPVEPAIAHLADIMANALGKGCSGEQFIPPLNVSAWESIELSINSLGLTIKQMNRQIEEISRHLFNDE
ncbi:MAG: HDOD domain-containing protein [Pseudomonadota bacterium]